MSQKSIKKNKNNPKRVEIQADCNRLFKNVSIDVILRNTFRHIGINFLYYFLPFAFFDGI